MKKKKSTTIDANEAVASIAHRVSEIIAIYPITPASPMGEWADSWSMAGQKNIWNTIPEVVELQSEGGAAGTVHGALQTGALTTSFTASQGLLLMMPNFFKIAGELTPTVIHVAARSVATHALSIFGDHSDVMAVRMTGMGMIASGSVQESMDLALIAHSATLKSRIPFIHFFDGFRTSHEIQKIDTLPDNDLRKMIDEADVIAHRNRALSPENPFIRGTAQNPDVFFQAREASNPFYNDCPDIIQKTMNRFAEFTGRSYHLFDFYGDPEAERIIVIMGSGAETVHETVEQLMKEGEKTGVVKVRLYRPFNILALLKAIPQTVRKIAVLDRTKEPGSSGEPLYNDVLTAIYENRRENYRQFRDDLIMIGGRYGLSSKEFTPSMVRAVFHELKSDKPKNHFTIGIRDDVTDTSLDYSETSEKIQDSDTYQALFYGLGSDGTVSANKNSIKIIGELTDFHAQGYFVYDSKKAGATTVSHLRFGPNPIRSAYLIKEADFIACHQFQFLERMDMLRHAREGTVFLLNAPVPAGDVWDYLPESVQEQILEKKIRVFSIDAYRIARDCGLGNRINTVMQVCFFAISEILKRETAIEAIRKMIQKSYGRKGEKVLRSNFQAIDSTLENLHEVKIPKKAGSGKAMRRVVPEEAPEFVQNVIAQIIAGKGDDLPVSSMPADGTFPSGTSKWEKRNISREIPVLNPDICIQCGKCALVCPHAVIRIKAYEKNHLELAPSTFKYMDSRGKEWPDNTAVSIQVSPEDCTGCELCVEVCPVKNKQQTGLKALNMHELDPLVDQEKENWDFFLTLPEYDRNKLKTNTVKGSQFLQPLFEFSGACSGCGETPYIKLVTQLFGDRMIVANATGCSSIYGGNLPTTPWTKNGDGRGPAWSNSLFEDNAEFGLGFRITLDKQKEQALGLLETFRRELPNDLVSDIIQADQSTEAGIFEQRERIGRLKKSLASIDSESHGLLTSLADYLVRKSVWIIGGDGWAYDIGYGGLDHVLASGKDVNILVLDTEVYSNTGGQRSKATPLGAVAKFAAAGKESPKKDLGLLAVSNGNAYVARIAMGADDAQTVRAILEAESYPGPSILIAYSHCIAHGYDLKHGLTQQKLAVDSGYWPLFRFDPRKKIEGENPFLLDSRAPKITFKEYAYHELRYLMLSKSNPKRAKKLMEQAQEEVKERWMHYEQMEAVYQPGREMTKNQT